MKPGKRVVFLGSKSMGLRCLWEIYRLSPGSLSAVVTVDDSGDARSVLSDFRRFCLNQSILFYIAKRRQEAEKYIRQLSPDLCIVVGWYWLISQKNLASVPGGFLGIHNSLLPKYRGGAPFNWAIMNGEKEIGISLFSLTDKMDAGDIWAQASMKLKDSHTISDVLKRMEPSAAGLFRKHYLDILKGRLTPSPQDHSKATVGAQRRPEDGLIDWKKTSGEIYNFIRAQSRPYPGAFTFFKKKKLVIWKARKSETARMGCPGQVVKAGCGGLTVICGDDKPLILTEIELNGKTVPPAAVNGAVGVAGLPLVLGGPAPRKENRGIK